MQDPLAYFITFHTYGSWLHGRQNGSVDEEHKAYGQAFAKADAKRHAARQQQMKHQDISLCPIARVLVLESVLETCGYRGWRPLAVHIRTNHVHCVVSAVNTSPEKVLCDLKAYATRRLRDRKLFARNAPVWSEHGSTRYLWDDATVEEKCHYTLHEQGEPMVFWPTSEHEA